MLNRNIELLRNKQPVPDSSADDANNEQMFSGMLLTEKRDSFLFLPFAESGFTPGERKTLRSVMFKRKVSDESPPVTTWYLTQITQKHEEFTPLLTQLADRRDHSLMAAFQLSLREDRSCLLVAGKKTKDKDPLHLVPELCRAVGRAKWYYFGKLLPSLLYRLQSLLLVEEARRFLFSGSARSGVGSCGAVGVVEHPVLPSLELMLEALTPKLCYEPFNSER